MQPVKDCELSKEASPPSVDLLLCSDSAGEMSSEQPPSETMAGWVMLNFRGSSWTVLGACSFQEWGVGIPRQVQKDPGPRQSGECCGRGGAQWRIGRADISMGEGSVRCRCVWECWSSVGFVMFGSVGVLCVLSCWMNKVLV